MSFNPVLPQIPVEPPSAKRQPKRLEAHGDVRFDDYFWLRDRSDPEVIRYLEAENRYTEAVTQHTRELQETLYTEIVSRIRETDLSVPVRWGDFYYYVRTEEGKQYPIYCRKKTSLSAPEEILLDGNLLAEGKSYFRVGVFEPSPDHRLLAYSTDVAGDEEYTLYFKDLITGELLPDRIERAYAEAAWAADNRTLFYNILDHAKRPDKLFRHRLGSPGREDALIFHESDERFRLSIDKTRNRLYLLLSLSSSTSTEVHYLRTDQPGEPFQLLYARRPLIEYDVAQTGDHFYVRTNDGGKNFRLVRAPLANPIPENWEEIIPHRTDVLLEEIDAFRDHIAVTERHEGLRRLVVRKLSTGESHFIEFPEPVYTVFVAENPEFRTSILRFQYTSLVTPRAVFDYDMDARTRELKKQYEVLGGYDPEQYASERIFARSADGARIPISLVYRKPLVRDGERPMLLQAYGAYGSSTDPVFSSQRLSLLDRGFLVAIAHVRGGAELGKFWHEQGRMLQKKNTFLDFLASAEHLIEHNYTGSRRLAITGGSAGGLLVGAVVNLRPDLFQAAIAKVPFVDVLNTMMDPTLPLTVSEYEEWGNPEKLEFYEYIRSYSPYDNVRPVDYPHLLVTAGLNDPRVSYWEPAKWVARLRATKQGGRRLLLKTNLDAGHFGASGRYDRFRETAFDYAFLLDTLSIGD